MNLQSELFERFVPPADVVYTPDYVSKFIVDYLNPSAFQHTYKIRLRERGITING